MNTDPAFDLSLEEALQLLASGVSREECLRRFPRYATELAPLLSAAESARAGLLADQPMPTPNLARGKRRFLEAARAPAQRPGRLLNTRLASAMLVWLSVILIGTGVASANALPGDALYPVKRGLEAAQLALTFDPEARARTQAAQTERRRAEAQQVLDLRRETRLEFEGVVETVERDALQISGLRVLTEAASEFQIADRVYVVAHTSAEALFADQIILLARPTPTATLAPTRAPIATATREPDTPTPTLAPTRQSLTATRVPPTATATPTALRPTQTTPTDTPTPPPTEMRPTETPTNMRVTDSPTPEATATVPRPTPTPTGRP